MKHLTQDVEDIKKDIQDIHVKMNKHAKKCGSIGVPMKKGNINAMRALDTIMGQEV
jgi:hypothetical protein